MIGENRQLVTYKPVEFEKKPVEVQDCRKIINHFRGIHRIYPILFKEITGGSQTCNQLDLQTLATILKCSLFKTSTQPPTHAPKAYQTWKVLQAKQPTPYQKS